MAMKLRQLSMTDAIFVRKAVTAWVNGVFSEPEHSHRLSDQLLESHVMVHVDENGKDVHVLYHKDDKLVRETISQ